MADQRITINQLFFSPVPTSEEEKNDQRRKATSGGGRIQFIPQFKGAAPVRESKHPTPPDRPGTMAGHYFPKRKASEEIERERGHSLAQRASALENVDARVTLYRIKEKATILKNVHESTSAGSISDEEQYIFKLVTLKLEKHLAAEDNLFRLLFCEFQNYLLAKYLDIIFEANKRDSEDQLSDLDESQVLQLTELLCNEVKEFINISVKCLILFYNFDICNFRVVQTSSKKVKYVPCTILNFDNLMNFTTAIMFPKQVYELVLRYFEFKNREKNRRLMMNMHKYKHIITMNSLGVSDRFQLRRMPDTERADTSRGTHNNMHPSFSREVIPEEGMDDSMEPKLLNLSKSVKQKPNFKRQTASVKEHSIASSTTDDITGDPYASAIKTLRYISEVESPLEKMKVLLLVIRKIINSINEFYKGSEEKTEVLTGDQTMALVVYVVLHSKVPNMFSCLEYVYSFLPDHMSSTFTGYYLTVFTAACEYIVDFKQNDNSMSSS